MMCDQEKLVTLLLKPVDPAPKNTLTLQSFPWNSHKKMETKQLNKTKMEEPLTEDPKLQ